MPGLADPAEVRAHLVAAAQAGVAVTYSELLGRLGHPFSRPKMRALCATLSAVDREAEAQGEPELAVLVVRQSDGIPGQGWWVEAARASTATRGLGKGRKRGALSMLSRPKPSASGGPAAGQVRRRGPVNQPRSPIGRAFPAWSGVQRKTMSLKRLFLATMLTAALTGCERSDDPAASKNKAANDTDPALTSAIEDQILVDPALTQQSNKNAVQPPETPPQAQYPADAPRTGPAERARQSLWDGGARCGDGPFNYHADWARRLPPEFALPPGAKLTEAAGNNERGCSMRVVTFTLAQPAERVLDFYRARALNAGYSAEQQRRDGDQVLAGSNASNGHYYLIVTPKPNGSEVALIANQGA
jgi:hypothetical protein